MTFSSLALNGISQAELLSDRTGNDPTPLQTETSFSIKEHEQKALGQIAGIAVSPENELLLFSRRDRVWQSE